MPNIDRSVAAVAAVAKDLKRVMEVSFEMRPEYLFGDLDKTGAGLVTAQNLLARVQGQLGIKFDRGMTRSRHDFMLY